MVWDPNAPVMVAQLRTQWAALPAWIAAVTSEQATATIHFPTSNPAGILGGDPDPLPHCVLVQTSRAIKRIADGCQGLPSGQLEVTIYVSSTGTSGESYTAGELEQLAETLLSQLMAQEVGIPFTGEASATMAGDPSPGEIAADGSATPSSYRTITVTLPFGYST